MFQVSLEIAELDETLTLSSSDSQYPRLSAVREVMRCICSIQVLFNKCSGPPLICPVHNRLAHSYQNGKYRFLAMELTNLGGEIYRIMYYFNCFLHSENRF